MHQKYPPAKVAVASPARTTEGVNATTSRPGLTAWHACFPEGSREPIAESSGYRAIARRGEWSRCGRRSGGPLSGRLRLRARWPPRTTPLSATAANDFGLRSRGRSRRLLLRHLLGNRLRWTTGTTGPPCPTSPATAATAPVLRRLRRRRRRDAAEQRVDRGADFLLHKITYQRHDASLPRHPTLLADASIRIHDHGQRR